VFNFVEVGNCTPYPEAELNATGVPFKGTNPDGTVFGWVDSHMHLGGSEALGGKIGYGSPFHKFGIVEAIGNCEVDHGPMGSAAAVDHLLGTGSPVNRHDTIGWPTYKDWPKWSSQGHHQTYYLWVKRSWLGGQRLMINHLVANEVLCTIWPQKQNDCNEMVNARLQHQLILDMQDYIDAQEGGPGKGFFRIVNSPAEARKVIADGKLAVVFGIEAEKILDCGEQFDMPECTKADIDKRLDEWHQMGMRFAFPLHIFDNAFGGAEFSRYTKDTALLNLYNAGNIYETGHPYATIPCSEANEVEEGEAETQSNGVFDTIAALVLTPMPTPATATTACIENGRTLTATGEHFVNRMIDYGMVIETDHSGALARKRIMDIAKSRNVAVVSGHTGSISVQRDSQRLANMGAILSTLPDKDARTTIAFYEKLKGLYPAGTTIVTGLGSDINGIHAQAPPRTDAATLPLKYPFKSYDGRITFDKQRTGQRVFDLNVDGVSHYGLYPDYLADIQQLPGGEEALQAIFRSAEGYLQLWERSERARTVRP
jgi:microsomal dipeptidase-like Zn-dependent dipeptidase